MFKSKKFILVIFIFVSKICPTVLIVLPPLLLLLKCRLCRFIACKFRVTLFLKQRHTFVQALLTIVVIKCLLCRGNSIYIVYILETTILEHILLGLLSFRQCFKKFLFFYLVVKSFIGFFELINLVLIIVLNCIRFIFELINPLINVVYLLLRIFLGIRNNSIKIVLFSLKFLLLKFQLFFLPLKSFFLRFLFSFSRRFYLLLLPRIILFFILPVLFKIFLVALKILIGHFF